MAVRKANKSYVGNNIEMQQSSVYQWKNLKSY